MNSKDYAMKANVVVWQKDKLPVIETFYGPNDDDLKQQIKTWMENNNYTKSHITIYKKDLENPDGWQVLYKGSMNQLATLPEFAYLCPGRQEWKNKDRCPIADSAIIHVPSGRIFKVLPEEKGAEGLVNVNLIFSSPSNPKQIKYILSFVKVTEEEMNWLHCGLYHKIEKKIEKDMLHSFIDWFLLERSLD